MIGCLVWCWENLRKDDHHQYIASSPNARVSHRPRACLLRYCVQHTNTLQRGSQSSLTGARQVISTPKPVWGLWAHNTGQPLRVHNYTFFRKSLYRSLCNRYWGIRHKWKVRLYCTMLAVKYPISPSCKPNALITSPQDSFTWDRCYVFGR